ncbi:MAG TPA: PQQ-binding-like beta-propeller repeat protein [Pirellulaceae bacterium]|nr:PQQ-binding-like beta-propeller repeat protein [Pirellulaceae bacterium]
MHRPASLYTFALMLLCCATLGAAEWTQFRGPEGNGHATATGIPLEWSDSLNVTWKQAVPGEGWSSPVVSDGTIYLTAAVPIDGAEGDLSLRLLSLSAKTGEQLNSIEIFRQDGATAPKIHSKNSHASPTPIIEGDRVYVHFGHQGTACVSREGKVLWRTRELAYAPVHGNGGTPIVVDDLLIFSCDGAQDPFVAGIEKESGKVRWKTLRKSEVSRKFSFATPTLINVEGERQLISPGSGEVSALDPLTGEELWRVDYGDGYSVIPKPVFANGLVFVCTGWNPPNLLAIRPDGRGDVTETHVVWQTDDQAPNTPSLLVVGDELYMVADKGVASCLDTRTGEVYWEKRLGGNYSASPLYVDGRIYFQSEQGETTVIAPGRKYQKLATSELGEPTLASYGVVDNALLIRSEKHLYRIEAE